MIAELDYRALAMDSAGILSRIDKHCGCGTSIDYGDSGVLSGLGGLNKQSQLARPAWDREARNVKFEIRNKYETSMTKTFKQSQLSLVKPGS